MGISQVFWPLKYVKGVRSLLATWVAKLGISVATGALFLWLALRNVEFAELRRAFGLLDISWCLIGMALYWTALLLRILRWRLILAAVAKLTIPQVGLALIIGYAVNALLQLG